ncbi:MAG: ribonuclease E/G, partial [Anaerotignum sp.]
MKRVLLDVKDGMTRVALVADGKLVELYYETKREKSLVGNIYIGRVEKVVPNLQACFVEIGEQKNGYLYYGNARAVSDEGKNIAKPKAGDSVLVQVEKDATKTKGMVLTQKISFPGKFLVLLREDEEIGISRKITYTAERERIRNILGEILPKTYGGIVRTNGQDRSKDEYEKEIALLLEKEKKIAGWEFKKAPTLLLEQSLPLEKATRDFYSEEIDTFIVNDKESYGVLLETGDFNGQNQPALLLYQDKLPIFEEFFVETQAQKALDERVWLKSGGFLVIQETEACVVVDV